MRPRRHGKRTDSLPRISGADAMVGLLGWAWSRFIFTIRLPSLMRVFWPADAGLIARSGQLRGAAPGAAKTLKPSGPLPVSPGFGRFRSLPAARSAPRLMGGWVIPLRQQTVFTLLPRSRRRAAVACATEAIKQPVEQSPIHGYGSA